MKDGRLIEMNPGRFRRKKRTSKKGIIKKIFISLKGILKQ